MRWSRTQCIIEHPQHGQIPVESQQGCPIVSRQWGNLMLSEIEDHQRKRAKIRAILHENVLAETTEEKRVAELATLFPQVPHRILEQVVGEKSWKAEELPWNRRQRRTILQAKGIVIHAFSGADTKRWQPLERAGIAVVNVDIVLGANLLDSNVSVGSWRR